MQDQFDPEGAWRALSAAYLGLVRALDRAGVLPIEQARDLCGEFHIQAMKAEGALTPMALYLMQIHNALCALAAEQTAEPTTRDLLRLIPGGKVESAPPAAERQDPDDGV